MARGGGRPPLNEEGGSTVTVDGIRPLRFDTGAPVRSASAIARLGNAWLIAQDDANHAAVWDRERDAISTLRLFPPTDGHDTFSERRGTKHLKPDVESAATIAVGGEDAVLLLGSGSLPTRRRAALVVDTGGRPRIHRRDVAPLYDAVADALDLPDGALNLEGACVIGDRLRWFQRGNAASEVGSASVDVPLDAVVGAIRGDVDPATIAPSDVRRYALPAIDGAALTITDAVAVDDVTIVVSAAAEDTPDAVADCPVTGSALAVVVGGAVVAVAPLATGTPLKVEGLAVTDADRDRLRLLAVTDADDPDAPSCALDLTVPLPRGLRPW